MRICSFFISFAVLGIVRLAYADEKKWHRPEIHYVTDERWTFDLLPLALEQWNDVCSGVRLIDDGVSKTATITVARDGVNLVRLERGAWPFDPTIIGITVKYYDQDGGIFDADIILRDDGTIRLSQAGEPPESMEVDRLGILTHEIGHSLGLEHTETPGALMLPAHQYGETRRTPQPTDIEALHVLYPQTDESCIITPRGEDQTAGCSCENESVQGSNVAFIVILASISLLALLKRG